MDIVTIFRFIVPFLAILLFLIIARLTRAPKVVVVKALSVCWIAGVLNAIVDSIAGALNLWHYTLNYLLVGLPIDFYLSVSLIYGAGICLLFWWIKINHRRYLLPFLLVLPFWGLLRDTTGVRLSGSAFLIWDNPYWYVADFLSWMIILWLTIFLFQKWLHH